MRLRPRYDELSRARTVNDVIDVTKAYLASWTTEDLLSLPEGCRPVRVQGPQDIEAWADRLYEASGSALLVHDDERRLDRITSHFLIAAVKLRQVAPAALVA